MLQQNQINKEGTFWDHIEDLRSKFMLCLVTTLVGAIIVHIYYPYIFAFLLKSLGGQRKLVFLSILDPVIFIFKIDLAGGVILASPIISWMIFSFIRPAISETAWSKIVTFYISSLLLAASGLFYAYFVSIPICLKFLFSITIPGIDSIITAQSYLSFLLTQCIISALIFQIPLFMVVGIHMNIFKADSIASKRRYIYLIILIVLSMVTPTTDLFTLAMVLLPTVVIFEGGLLASRYFEKRNNAILS